MSPDNVSTPAHAPCRLQLESQWPAWGLDAAVLPIGPLGHWPPDTWHLTLRYLNGWGLGTRALPAATRKRRSAYKVKTNRGSKSDTSLCMDEGLCTSWGWVSLNGLTLHGGIKSYSDRNQATAATSSHPPPPTPKKKKLPRP